MKNHLNAFLGTLVVIALSQATHAFTWDTDNTNGTIIDAGSGNWNTVLTDISSANTVWNDGTSNVIWSQTSATSATNSAIFGGVDATTTPYTITVDENIAATSLSFLNSGYTLSAAAAQTIISPTITVASGSSAAIGSNLTIKPVNGTSAMTLKGPGTLNINSGATVKDYGGNNVLLNTGVNVNVLTGGLLTASSQFVVGDVNGGAQLNVTGGSATITNTGTGNLVVSNIGSGTGTGTSGLKITGGIVTNSSTTGGLRFGNNSVGSFTNNGTVDLDGGTLSVAKIYEGTGGTTTSTFNFNGGTLKVLTGTTFAPTFMTGLDNAFVKEGGAVINSNGIDTTLAQALLDGVALGTDGGLTKNGAGKLTLTKTNTYTGTTTVSEGTLAIGAGGSIDASSQIIVGANTTLDVSAVAFTLGSTNAQSLSGTGTVAGGITVGANGTLAIGTSPGTMTFNNNLTLDPSSTSDFEITTLTLGGYDLAKAATIGTQTVSFNGGILNLLFQTGFNTEGTAKLFDFDTYAGTGFTSVVSTGLADGYTASFDRTNGIVTVVPEPNAAALLGGFGLLALLRRRRA